MPKDKFPEGLKIQEKEGVDILPPLLEKLKKYSFRGYLKILYGKFDGYIVIKDGNPRNALLYKDDELTVEGEKALDSLKEKSSEENLKIQVYTKVDIDELISSYGGTLEVDERVEPSEESTEDVHELVELLQEEKQEEEIVEESLEAEEIEKDIKKKEREEKELEVYDMIIKERRGEKRDDIGEFPEKFSFDNFVEGKNNKLTFSAAKEIAKKPGVSFNPLYIHSKTGLGKTHIIKAIGHFIRKNHEKSRVKYTTTDKCTSDLLKIYRGETDPGKRDEYFNTDILLIDDVQFLAGRKKSQEIMFYLLDTLFEKNCQIVITGDRHPDNLPNYNERLVSRFKSGLVVEIKPPSYKTRLKIIEQKVSKHDIDVPEEAIEFLAKNLKKNIREVEGAINRILAFSSLLDQPITIESVKESLHKQVTSSEGSEESEDIINKLTPGESYIIEEDRPKKGFEILNKMVDSKRETYAISRMNPTRIREEYDLDESKIFWLTSKDSKEEKTVPPNLENITWRLEEIVGQDSIILLDGLEYLISQTSFDATIQFIRHTVDTVSETDSIFLLTVSPSALEQKHISILRREMAIIYQK